LVVLPYVSLSVLSRRLCRGGQFRPLARSTVYSLQSPVLLVPLPEAGPRRHIGAKRFPPGPAIAVALAHTTDRGKTNDAHQWLVPVTLVEELAPTGLPEAC
jgi:hypothetical protein